MKKLIIYFAVLLFCIALPNCVKQNPNKELEQGILKENKIPESDDGFSYPIKKDVYIPIYSDIYNKTKDFRFQLTATLSIRNTSPKDTLFIKKVDYYNTTGGFVRGYIEQPIYLKPLESIEYVIEEEDTAGGSGANFLITWGANKTITPIFQGVMVGVSGQQGLAFTTEGVIISESE
ncbi:uncharacterized protein DUF3124 [Aquimarina sp. MAR_2010_214]|uniref:DUF3124 domain-containing protein n=1 Tax=Aquimarina sp. MAR_2010_214 TaxID=1250026 RepID=UPI000C706475|nr:DUF3124 domain-containing protein [Aquimarina sp. MAR_2010_214]PKV50234.1 uncharacterized protein DUF3124 [Aquimarina sp. MAR_2010_214]